MSARARRYFGCLLPLALALFGCGALAMLGYAGQIFVQIERVPDGAMAPVLRPGWQVVVDNTAHWTADPARGTVVLIARPGGRAFRRIVGLPGERVEIAGGTLRVNGATCDGATPIHDAICNPGGTPGQRLADLAPLALAPGAYFVMAEDWTAADSRAWGPVPRADIFGIPIFRRGGGGFEPIVWPTPRAPAGPPDTADEAQPDSPS